MIRRHVGFSPSFIFNAIRRPIQMNIALSQL